MTDTTLEATTECGGPKPYHHGDLQRALIEAADRILERDGAGALSLRAVAREAGVSPAAPYHHFKDKDELVSAVAHRGFDLLAQTMAEAAEGKVTDGQQALAIGVAYVCFARDHSALYHVMFDPNRKRDMRPTSTPREQTGAYGMTKAIRTRQAAGTSATALDIELATIAGWCAAHGLAEMSHYPQFDELKQELGGEKAFFEAVLGHLDMLHDR